MAYIIILIYIINICVILYKFGRTYKNLTYDDLKLIYLRRSMSYYVNTHLFLNYIPLWFFLHQIYYVSKHMQWRSMC